MSSVMPINPDPPLLLLDTHIWVWLMLATADLSTASRAAINNATSDGRLLLSAISLWEISLLAFRNRLELGKPSRTWIAESLVAPGPAIEPLTTEIAVEAGELPGGFRSDPADLIIVATARITGATLLTRDRRILDYAASGHLPARRA
jgi:PIN domain nuclease of toxin-antitoxin system